MIPRFLYPEKHLAGEMYTEQLKNNAVTAGSWKHTTYIFGF